MPECPDLLTIQSYVDGELSRADAEGVRRHLRDCADCREIAERLKLTSALLASALPATPPADLLQRIEAAVAGRGKGIGCEQAHEYIHAALDTELEANRAEFLDAHISECADCRHYQERTRVTVHALRAVEHVTPPEGLRARIEAAVDGVAYPSFDRLRRRLVNVAGLAAAAAILMVALLSNRGLQVPGGVVSNTTPPTTISIAPTGPDTSAAPSQPVSAPDADDGAGPAAISATPAGSNTTDRLATASAMKRRLKPRAVDRSRSATPPAASSIGGPPEMAVAVASVSVSPLVGAGPVSVGPTRDGAMSRIQKKPLVETSTLIAGIPSGLVTEAPVALTSAGVRPTAAVPRPTLAKATPTTPVSLRADTVPAHAPVGRRLPTVDESSSRSVHRSTPSPERLALAAARIDRQLDTSTVATELPSPW